jgi:integrase
VECRYPIIDAGSRSFTTRTECLIRRTSGKWQALYEHNGKSHSAGVFAFKADALVRLAEIEVDLRRGSWTDPRAGRILVRDFAEQWIDHRPGLAVRTRELYTYLLDNQISPALGNYSLATLSSSIVRSWNSDMVALRPSTAAKSYRLLSTIIKTAMIDGLITSTPCRVVGASAEHPVERPIASINDVEKLAEAMPHNLRIVVSLATWCQLRRGEILGLRRRDVDLEMSRIHIEQSRTFLRNGFSLVKAPKTRAGRRVIAVPGGVRDELAKHMSSFVGEDPDSFIVTNIHGEPVTAMVLQRAWTRARQSVGRLDLHLHDLRHTGLTFAATAGATTAELMHRAGHASSEAALRYQHATRDRDELLALSLDSLMTRNKDCES